MPQPPPRLRAITLEGYRCFRDEERLDLRPLTLVYGRNNAGKSAMLRALVMLGRSLGPSAQSPWDVGEEDGPGQGASFKSLPWRGSPSKRFTLQLAWASGVVDALTLEQDADLEPVVVRSIHPDRDGQSVRWEKVPSDEPSARYRRSDGMEEEVRFDGLVPLPGQHPLLDAVATRLASLRNQIQWLHGGRSRAVRDIRLSGATPAVLKPDGSDAARKLVMEHAALLPGVNAFYRELDRVLRHDTPRSDVARLFLDHPDRERWQIELADAGEGMSKVLPVLVAVEAAVKERGPGLVVVEDPDVHLHDDAARRLAEHLCARIGGDAPPTLVVETHSRTFLLAVQNKVRLGLAPKRVRIVWAQPQHDGHTRLIPVELDASGQPQSSELRGAFREDSKLAAELAGLTVPGAG